MKKQILFFKQRINLLIGGPLSCFYCNCCFRPVFAPYDPVHDADLMVAEQPPDKTFWFGTDEQGRDILSRVIYGSRISLSIGLVTQIINTVIGIVLGVTAGFSGSGGTILSWGLPPLCCPYPPLFLPWP